MNAQDSSGGSCRTPPRGSFWGPSRAIELSEARHSFLEFATSATGCESQKVYPTLHQHLEWCPPLLRVSGSSKSFLMECPIEHGFCDCGPVYIQNAGQLSSMSRTSSAACKIDSPRQVSPVAGSSGVHQRGLVLLFNHHDNVEMLLFGHPEGLCSVIQVAW
ncbi:hypothetical protein MPH_03391 [Macrophomina phaseolina MS6]|uniref:Uncharacterized protein n=1 Tax=Macrophomina phaseolina (strain MS6) TaxID=1126212 RepID=K2S3E8_MACPH|nr:hypothetical protein MPH_03391 [Macrophomina phaseolina MS6]